MGTQQFCLRWNNHQSNMLNVFDQLLQNGDFVDVTLACEGVSIKAHKMVLSACSPYFQNLFRDNPCKHPIVILKDMKYAELRSIVDFMYKGEINVSQDQLSALLKTAETLKVKGLAEVSGGNIPGARAMETAAAASSEEAASSSGGPAATTTTAPQSSSSPSRNSPQRSDGRASPHSKRKRNRPTRRRSNGEIANNESASEGNYEMANESDDGRVPLPKMEPLDLLAEPPLDILMDADSRYHLDAALAERSDSNHDPQDGDPRELPSRADGFQSCSSLSQPSTSGTQSANQDLDCSRSRRWKHTDMRLAIEAVRAGFGIKSASKRYGIPTMTLWRWTQKFGVTSVFAPYGGRKPRGGAARASASASAVAVQPGLKQERDSSAVLSSLLHHLKSFSPTHYLHHHHQFQRPAFPGAINNNNNNNVVPGISNSNSSSSSSSNLGPTSGSPVVLGLVKHERLSPPALLP